MNVVLGGQPYHRIQVLVAERVLENVEILILVWMDVRARRCRAEGRVPGETVLGSLLRDMSLAEDFQVHALNAFLSVGDSGDSKRVVMSSSIDRPTVHAWACDVATGRSATPVASFPNSSIAMYPNKHYTYKILQSQFVEML
jgi:hypothetical protein